MIRIKKKPVWVAPSFYAVFVLIVGILLISSDISRSVFQVSYAPCIRVQTPAPSPKQLTEPDGDGRGNRFVLVENIVETLARDPKQSGDSAMILLLKITAFEQQRFTRFFESGTRMGT